MEGERLSEESLSVPFMVGVAGVPVERQMANAFWE